VGSLFQGHTPGGPTVWLYNALRRASVSCTGKKVSKLPHSYRISHAIWDHTVLPATQQWWLTHLYPSRSWYSI